MDLKVAEDFILWLANNHWVYLVFVLPATIFFLRFYKKNKSILSTSFFNFIEWAKPSMEENGEASAD